ncbi:MAG: hypothetical protein PHY12_15660, partial [Eubacteriales bacterium]|nr:hypothetical protein [Eubacteriales bacterium]
SAGAAYRVRHAISQVEQNAMAAQTDDLLRQQMGILFSCCKTAVGLLDVTVATKIWVAQNEPKKHRKGPAAALFAVAAGLQIFAGLIAYTKGLWLVWVSMAAALALTAGGFFAIRPRKSKEPQEEQIRVTARPDAEKLFQAIDAQMQAIDRYVNDFAYLNEQRREGQNAPDAKNLALISDMLEALSECDEDAARPAMEALERMLDGMGLRAEPYSPEQARYFTVLPSKTETRTLVPALLSAADGRLLRRGAAAVRREVQ